MRVKAKRKLKDEKFKFFGRDKNSLEEISGNVQFSLFAQNQKNRKEEKMEVSFESMLAAVEENNPKRLRELIEKGGNPFSNDCMLIEIAFKNDQDEIGKLIASYLRYLHPLDFIYCETRIIYITATNEPFSKRKMDHCPEVLDLFEEKLTEFRQYLDEDRIVSSITDPNRKARHSIRSWYTQQEIQKGHLMEAFIKEGIP